jgi:uncharacterized membrane protein
MQQSTDTPSTAPSLADHIDQNIENVAGLYRREREAIGASRRWVELVGRFIGRPIYLVAIVALASLWVIGNLIGHFWRHNSWDPPPFSLLDGIMTFVALLTTTIVLITQNRQTKLEQQRAHLDLQVNLLTEQKVTKLIWLIEELRRDLPMVKDRHDAHSAALQQPANTAEVLSAIENVGLARDDSYEQRPPAERKVR